MKLHLAPSPAVQENSFAWRARVDRLSRYLNRFFSYGGWAYGCASIEKPLFPCAFPFDDI
jgi:hypothetical protein